MKEKIKEYLRDVSSNFKNLEVETDRIEEAAKIIIKALENKNKVIFCGNGGSAADSQHLSAELMGRYKKKRKTFSMVLISQNNQKVEISHWIVQLQINENMTVLDIGCGWGGLSLLIAKETGAKVTGITLSKNQFNIQN